MICRRCYSRSIASHLPQQPPSEAAIEAANTLAGITNEAVFNYLVSIRGPDLSTHAEVNNKRRHADRDFVDGLRKMASFTKFDTEIGIGLYYGHIAEDGSLSEREPIPLCSQCSRYRRKYENDSRTHVEVPYNAMTPLPSGGSGALATASVTPDQTTSAHGFVTASRTWIVPDEVLANTVYVAYDYAAEAINEDYDYDDDDEDEWEDDDTIEDVPF